MYLSRSYTRWIMLKLIIEPSNIERKFTVFRKVALSEWRLCWHVKMCRGIWRGLDKIFWYSQKWHKWVVISRSKERGCKRLKMCTTNINICSECYQKENRLQIFWPNHVLKEFGTFICDSGIATLFGFRGFCLCNLFCLF